MIYIQAVKKRAQLRQILLVGAVATSTTVFNALLGFQTAVNEQNFQKGRQYISTSGNGQHASYQMASAGSEWTQENVFALSEEYFDILERTLYSQNTANAAAGLPSLVDDGTAPNTTSIFNAMLQWDDRLRTVNRRGLDVTLLGFPQVGQLGGPA